jgi:hypothetical protein
MSWAETIVFAMVHRGGPRLGPAISPVMIDFVLSPKCPNVDAEERSKEFA